MSSTINFPYVEPTNYTYDSSKVDIAGGVAKLKDIRPSDSTCAAFYSSTINLSWGEGTLTGTGTGSPTISGNKLDLSNASNQYVDYDADQNADSQQTGCLRIDYYPSYSNNPADTQYIFGVFKANNDGSNAVQIYHATNGNLYLLLKDSTGATITQPSLGAWNPTEDNKYTFELNWDLTTGATRLFIEGTQKGATATQTGTRSADIGLLRIGQHVNGTSGQSNFKANNLVYFTTVQHTSNHSGDLPFDDPIKYSIDDPTVEVNTSFKASDILSFTETSTINGSDNIKHIIPVDGVDKYYSGGLLTSDGTYSQSNTADEINTNAASFLTTRSSVKLKSFLHSADGGSTPELDLISFTYDSVLPDPSLSTLVELEGFVYLAGIVAASKEIKVRPYLAGFNNVGIFQMYEWQTIATTNSIGWFSGNIYKQPSQKYWEIKIGKQSYYTELPDQSTVDLSTLTLTLVEED